MGVAAAAVVVVAVMMLVDCNGRVVWFEGKGE